VKTGEAASGKIVKPIFEFPGERRAGPTAYWMPAQREPRAGILRSASEPISSQ
jgi:hypothetical protein